MVTQKDFLVFVMIAMLALPRGEAFAQGTPSTGSQQAQQYYNMSEGQFQAAEGKKTGAIVDGATAALECGQGAYQANQDYQQKKSAALQAANSSHQQLMSSGGLICKDGRAPTQEQTTTYELLEEETFDPATKQTYKQKKQFPKTTKGPLLCSDGKPPTPPKYDNSQTVLTQDGLTKDGVTVDPDTGKPVSNGGGLFGGDNPAKLESGVIAGNDREAQDKLQRMNLREREKQMEQADGGLDWGQVFNGVKCAVQLGKAAWSYKQSLDLRKQAEANKKLGDAMSSLRDTGALAVDTSDLANALGNSSLQDIATQNALNEAANKTNTPGLPIYGPVDPSLLQNLENQGAGSGINAKNRDGFVPKGLRDAARATAGAGGAAPPSSGGGVPGGGGSIQPDAPQQEAAGDYGPTATGNFQPGNAPGGGGGGGGFGEPGQKTAATTGGNPKADMRAFEDYLKMLSGMNTPTGMQTAQNLSNRSPASNIQETGDATINMTTKSLFEIVAERIISLTRRGEVGM